MKKHEFPDAVVDIITPDGEMKKSNNGVGDKNMWKILVPIIACVCLLLGSVAIVKYFQSRSTKMKTR